MSTADLNSLCDERGWSRAGLIRMLRTAAKSRGSELPDDANLNRMIRMWSAGTRGLSPFYAELLSDVFETTFATGKPSAPTVTRRSVLANTAIAALSAKQSATLIQRLAATVEPYAIEQVADDVRRLAIDYISGSPLVIAEEAKELRDTVMVSLERTKRPGQIRDLCMLAGQLGGVLAYTALDLGNVPAAMTNARSALMCADVVGDISLTAWARGTQSLIARFANQYTDAEKYLREGMALNPRGIGLSRLASGLAQCRAQFGDVDGTRAALKLASDTHDIAEPTDDEVGVFGFPRSKVHHYATISNLILPEGVGVAEAVSEAVTAIELFQSGPAEDLFVTDAILVHIYGATAHILRGELDAAANFLHPVLELPSEQRVAWHRKRLASLTKLLASPNLQRSKTAVDLRSQLAAF